VKDPPASIG